jgi:hypothetical protein
VQDKAEDDQSEDKMGVMIHIVFGPTGKTGSGNGKHDHS